MKPKFRVIRFYKIQFDENWKLASTTNQIFTYITLRKEAVVQIAYEAPTGAVFTTTLVVIGREQKAYVHRDVIHVNSFCKGIEKGDKIKCG